MFLFFSVVFVVIRHLSSVSMFITELVLWNLLQVYLAVALDHFEFTDVRFGMRVTDTATVF